MTPPFTKILRGEAHDRECSEDQMENKILGKPVYGQAITNSLELGRGIYWGTGPSTLDSQAWRTWLWI